MKTTISRVYHSFSLKNLLPYRWYWEIQSTEFMDSGFTRTWITAFIASKLAMRRLKGESDA